MGSIGSIGLALKEGIELAVAVAVVILIARIIFRVCGHLLRYKCMFAPLFGAYFQTCIDLCTARFAVILSRFNGLFGGSMGCTIAPIIGAYTIQNKGLITPNIGVASANFIGLIMGFWAHLIQQIMVILDIYYHQMQYKMEFNF